MSRELLECQGKVVSLQEERDLLEVARCSTIEERDRALEMVARIERDNNIIVMRNLELDDQVKKLEADLATVILSTD